MENYSDVEVKDYSEFINLYTEKTEIRRKAKLLGIAYLILIAIPYVWADIYILLATRLGFSANEAIAVLSDPAVLQVAQIVLSSVMFLLPFLIVLGGTRCKITELISFEKPKKNLFLPLVLVAVGFCAFANIATNTIAGIFASFGIEYSAPEIETPDGFFGAVLVFLATAVTPALVEEFAMRGIVMGSLRKHGDRFAIIVSSILFGLVHCNFMQIPFAFAVGLAIAYAVIKTGSIWTGVVIHFINNFISLCLDSLFERIESVNIQSSITAIYFALCFLCFFVGLYLLKKTDSKDLELEKGEKALSLKESYTAFFTHPVIIIGIAVTFIFCVISM